ncbi:protein kinase [Schistosoma mansoni]|uniref:protein kinase n=1 Tax=Schistosoma mansoni TaxID=6183 RepID=UPI0001A62F6C|nr:protein kinase [Schistosoma mansoni]|eukprot:XP_018652732.1 protein kinase [Schistosoma mansoni]
MNASHVNNNTTTTNNNNNHITNTNYTTNYTNNISNIKNNKNISIDFPTNPITKYFIINKQIASCGPELIWKVYDAVRRQDQLPCSVFLFDKSIADKLHKPRRRDIVTSVLKRDVRLLTQLHHPNMLHILHPIEETSETLSFASERIFSSLANILGNHTRLQQFIIENLKTFRFTDMDRKLGIYQLTELLRFLHTGQSLFHNNVSPSSILITHQNQWRLGSAAFIESTCLEKHDISQSNEETTKRNLYHSTNKNDPDHTIDPITSTMKSNDKPGPWSDMFSLGLIICALYTNNSPAEGSIQWLQNIKKRDYDNDTYSNTDVLYVNCKENIIQETSSEFLHGIQLSQSSNIPEAFRLSVCRMPLELVEPVEKLLSRNPQKRPSSQLFALLKFFNDPTMLLLDGIINFQVKSDEDRTRALQILQNNAENLSKPILYGRIMPTLIQLHRELETRQFNKQINDYNTTMLTSHFNISQLSNEEICINLDSLLISGLAHLIEVCSSIDYTDYIEKDLINIFEKSSNLKLASLHCLVTILTRLSDATIVNDVIPFLLNVSNELKLNINNNKPTDKYVQDFNIDTVDDKAYDEHDQTQSNRVEQPISELCTKKSITRTTASFVPMLHPNQIKELENSPNITRRASAHVICPLPPQNSDLRFDKPTSDINLSDKKNYTSFLGLQLPSVSKLRRHSCDAQRQEKNTSSHMQVDKMNDNLSRRSSDQSLQDNDRTNWYTIPKSRGLLNSEEKNLLTAQVCEGPFIRTSNIQTKLNWNSSQVNEPVKQITSNNKLGNELSVGPRTSRRSSLIAIGDSVMTHGSKSQWAR